MRCCGLSTLPLLVWLLHPRPQYVTVVLAGKQVEGFWGKVGFAAPPRQAGACLSGAVCACSRRYAAGGSAVWVLHVSELQETAQQAQTAQQAAAVAADVAADVEADEEAAAEAAAEVAAEVAAEAGASGLQSSGQDTAAAAQQLERVSRAVDGLVGVG